MNEILLQLRDHLNSMLKIIENYQIPDDDIIIINKEDLKYLKWISELQPHVQLFEYKNNYKFTLRTISTCVREFEVYKKIIDGSIDKICLNKIDPINTDSIVNYKLEPWIKTKLRENYG
jgi:hypothetical protein